MDESVPRASLDAQGQMNRAGLVVDTVRSLGAPESALATSDIIDAARDTCDAADAEVGAEGIIAEVDVRNPEVRQTLNGTAWVVFGALTKLCPEHSQIIDSLGR